MNATRTSVWLLLITALAAAFALGVGVRFGTFSAGDTDPFGYVSQAELMTSGTLHVDLSFARDLRIPDAESAVVPPGYTQSPDGQSGVPVYAPGLPLVMAAALRLTGRRDAVFFVVPILAALGVWMTYLIGRRLDGQSTGAMAAVLVATSPAFLAQVVRPVSDLPATAFWTGALALALRSNPTWSLAGGLMTSMAILTRPNLVPLAAVVGAFLIWQAHRAAPTHKRQHVQRVLWFAAGAVPGAVTVGIVNTLLHGSALRSGYGPLGDLFGPEHVLPNLNRYPRWLVETHTPFILLSLLAPAIASRRVGAGLGRASVWLLLAFAFMLLMLNLFYAAWGYDEWAYVRFMLPAVPALLVLSVVVASRIVRAWLPQVKLRGVALVVIIGGLALWQIREAERRGVFVEFFVERRYPDVGRFVGQAMPPSAVFVSGLHSGSIRYYSDRMTLNYVRLDYASLDRAIRNLQELGHEAFIVLEDGEQPEFGKRFPRSDYSKLDWPPRYRTYEGVPVAIWDPRDRDQYLQGLPVVTYDIHRREKPVSSTIKNGGKTLQ